MTDEVKAKPKFSARDFGVAEFKRTVYHLSLSEVHTIADVSNPRLWGDILDKMKRGDLVEAFKPDTGAFAKFVVCECAPGFIRFGKIEAFEPAEVEVPDNGFVLFWNPGRKCHEVRRKADGYVMASGFQTRDTAAAWIVEHEKKVAA